MRGSLVASPPRPQAQCARNDCQSSRIAGATADANATAERFPWDRPDYGPQPAAVRKLRARIEAKSRELRELLEEFAELVEGLDLSGVSNGFDARQAEIVARAARATEWAVESGVSQVVGGG